MLWEFFFPFSGCWEGVYVSVSALSRQIFHSVLQVMFIKEFPKHCQRPPALTVKPDDHFGCIQFFFFWVWVATGQCLSKRWYSRPLVLVVVCPVFILLCAVSRNGPPIHSNRVAMECLWNLTQKPQLVLLSFEINKTRVSTISPARDPIKSVRAARSGTSWQTALLCDTNSADEIRRHCTVCFIASRITLFVYY